MKCEGEKIYHQPGSCPVCGMFLAPIENAKNHKHNENTSCCSVSSKQDMHNAKADDKTASDGQYICPMKCEGEKIYHQPGSCPVCGMFLAPIESAKGHTRNENTSCCSVSSKQDMHNAKADDKTASDGQYICPMKCEGEKIYHQPGSCPVCGMFLAPIENAKNHTHNENTSCCSVTNKYTDKPKPTKSSAGKYYCPMHCEGDKLYDTPGNCPVCGMNLEKFLS